MRRRLLILAAVAMGVAAITTSMLAPRRTPPPAQPPAATSSAPPTPSPATGEPEVRTMRAEASGQVAEGTVGRRLVLEVRSDAPISVQVGTDGPIAVAEAASPARFELFVDEPLDRPVTVLGDERVIGRVRARG